MSKFVPTSTLFTASTSMKHLDYKGCVELFSYFCDEIEAAWDLYSEMLENHTNGSKEGEDLVAYILDCNAFTERIRSYAHTMWEYYGLDFRKLLVPTLMPMPF